MVIMRLILLMTSRPTSMRLVRGRPPPKEMCSRSRDLNFWQITDNISETVQDKDTVQHSTMYNVRLF